MARKTSLDEEQEKKRKSAEAKEIIETIGAKGARGRKAAKKYFKEEEKKEEVARAIEEEKLEKSRKSFFTYSELLADLLRARLFHISWPDKWQYQVVVNKDHAIVLVIMSPDQRFFRAGFIPTGERMYDLNAVEMYAIRAENTIDRLTMSDVVLGPDGKEPKDVN